MVSDPSPRCVGLEFVRQYYTVLNKAPSCLHRFYSNESKFLHSGDVVMGQTEIHKKILSLGFHDCHAKIQLVDAISTLGEGVLIQVTGELSNNGLPMRKFTQSIVLAPQSPKKYYVHNDIFHYIDEVFVEDGQIEDRDNEVDEECEIGTTEIMPDESFEKTVNGNLHEQESHVVNNIAMQPVAPEHTYSAVEASPSVMGGSSQPAPLSPIPHINPQLSETVISNPLSQSSVKEDVSNGAVSQSDDWLSNESPTQDTSPVKEEEKPKLVSMEEPKPIPQPVVSNEPKTYANLLKNSSNSSFPASTIQPVATNHLPEPAVMSNLTNHPKPEPRSYAKPSGNDSATPTTTFQKSTYRPFQDDERRRFLMPDSHQVFVGNLPHTISDEELKDTFREFGKVVDVRINTAKGKTSSTKGVNHTVPNFGFISFDSEESVEKCLEARPIYLNGESRINVEEKKARTSRMEGGGSTSIQRPLGNRGGLRGGMSQGPRGGMRGGFNRGGENNRGDRGGRGTFSQRR